MVDKMSDVQLPKFLTREYLERILQTFFKDPKITVTQFNVQPAVKPGENYYSDMLRASVRFRQASGIEVLKSLILKIALQNPEAGITVKELDVNRREMIMYTKILPECLRMLQSIGDSDSFFPATYDVNAENRVFVLEDLKELGYQLAERKIGIDMDHGRLVVEKLAKLHATSMIMYEKDPIMFEHFQKGVMNSDSDMVNQNIFLLLESLIEVMRTWNGFEKYVKKLEQMEGNFIEMGCRIFDKIDNATTVLLHGDGWTSNFMFKYDEEGHVEDVKLIDFQLGTINSPTLDLIYLASTSIIDGIFRIDEILKFYHERFKSILKDLKYKGDIPTLFELRGELQAKGFFWFLSKLLLWPIMINEKEEGANLQTLYYDSEEGRRFRCQIFQNRTYKESLERILPKFDEMGLLDPIYRDLETKRYQNGL